MHREIADALELQPYETLEDVIKLVVKIEQQRKRGMAKVTKPHGSSSMSNYPSKAAPKPQFKKETPKLTMVDKGKAKLESSQPTRSRDIKCIKCLRHGHIASQCPNWKVMIVRNVVEEIVSEDGFDLGVEEEEEQVVSRKGGVACHSSKLDHTSKEGGGAAR